MSCGIHNNHHFQIFKFLLFFILFVRLLCAYGIHSETKLFFHSKIQMKWIQMELSLLESYSKIQIKRRKKTEILFWITNKWFNDDKDSSLKESKWIFEYESYGCARKYFSPKFTSIKILFVLDECFASRFLCNFISEFILGMKQNKKHKVFSFKNTHLQRILQHRGEIYY